jgi:hypothetical protein
MYDYYLGGKDNFAADREAADVVPVEAWRPAYADVEPDLDRAGFLAAMGRIR